MKVRNLEVKKGLLLALVTSLVLTATGCSKKSDCQEKEYHLHKYEKGKIVRFLPREELNYQGYNWTEKVYFTDPDFYEYADKNRLLEIGANKDYIAGVQNSQKDYYEYEYTFMTIMPMGKILMPITVTDWTTDPNYGGLTGNVRLCHPMHYAYKVEKDEKGKRRLVKSPLVEDILEIEDEYPMFREDFTEVVKTDVKDDTKEFIK